MGESEFCQYRRQFLDFHKDYTTYYNDAVNEYTAHVKKIKPMEAIWKAEYTAIQKILCYLKLWPENRGYDEDDVDDKGFELEDFFTFHCGRRGKQGTIDTSDMDVTP